MRAWIIGAGILCLLAYPVRALDGGREVREPPEWDGVAPEPGIVCPYEFTKRDGDTIEAICKTAIVGHIVNVKPFAPGPFEDKNDADWAFLSRYFNSKTNKLYFAATGCGSGDNGVMARGDARQDSIVNVLRLATIWNNELKRGKFRPYLEFRELERFERCRIDNSIVAGTEQQQEEDTQEQERDEAERREAEEQRRAQEEADREAATITITSQDSKTIYLALYSDDGQNLVWPGSDKIWPIRDSDEHKYRIQCTPGQKICYGAWREDNRTVVWGVGYNNQQRCTNCCFTCGNHNAKYSLGSGPSGEPVNEVSFEMRSLDRYAVELSFYNTAANRAWPGGNQIYPLSDSRFHLYTLSCRQGEKICYGAWRRGNAKTYWGVGFGGSEGCTGCCWTCGSGYHKMTLNGGPDSPPVADGGESTFSSVLDGVVTGLTLGSAIAGAMGSVRPTYSAPRTYSVPQRFPTRPAPRQSDITR